MRHLSSKHNNRQFRITPTRNNPKRLGNLDSINPEQKKYFPDNLHAFTMGFTEDSCESVLIDPIVVYYFLN